jgi:hypothetical protein
MKPRLIDGCAERGEPEATARAAHPGNLLEK